MRVCSGSRACAWTDGAGMVSPDHDGWYRIAPDDPTDERSMWLRLEPSDEADELRRDHDGNRSPARRQKFMKPKNEEPMADCLMRDDHAYERAVASVRRTNGGSHP